MILDTNTLSAFIDGEPAVGVRLSAESQVAIRCVLGEFRYGISGSRYRDKYDCRTGSTTFDAKPSALTL